MAASTRETWLFGSPPKAVEAPEKSFASARHLGMDLHADDDLPIAGRALDELLRVDRSVHGPALPDAVRRRGSKGRRPAPVNPPVEPEPDARC